MNLRGYGLIAASMCFQSGAYGREARPDTVSFTLPQAESAFVAQSVPLLAKRIEVGMAGESVNQAGVWDNPNLSVDQNIYNWNTEKYFDVTRSGQTALAFQQPIPTAGKRGKRVAVERANARITELEFQDLLRNLKRDLRTDFFAIYYLRAAVAMYDREILSVADVVKTFRLQYRNGNIALTDLSRLQAMLFELEDERREMQGDLRDKQADLDLKLLLPAGTETVPMVDTAILDGLSAQAFTREQLYLSGMDGRGDLKIRDAQLAHDHANLALQKAMRYPDLTIGGTWDRQGSYIENYNSLTLSMDLPIWNRNQGNIRIAELQIKASEAQAANAPAQLQNEVSQAYDALQETDALYREWKEPFAQDFDVLAKGISRGYERKSISLLEFVDFFQSYKDIKNRLYKLQNGRIDAFENINYVTGKDLYRFSAP